MVEQETRNYYLGIISTVFYAIMAEKIEKYSLAMTTCHFKMILKCQI
jgi:nicotinamide riboside transporter PnuC